MIFSTQPGRNGGADRRALLARSPDHDALSGAGRPASLCPTRDGPGPRGSSGRILRGVVSNAVEHNHMIQ
jgi:hypothetical protein